MKTKEAMKILAKLLSVVIVILLIWQTYLILNSDFIIHSAIKILPGEILRIIIFYTPLFYFAFSKQGKNKILAIWGKIMSIVLVAYFLFFVLAGINYNSLTWILRVISVPYSITNILATLIMGYFSWFDKNK